MLHEYSRMELLIGEDAVETLAKSRVAVFGIGGVGSYTAEALARCGVGVITLVDNDVVTLTNLNRQLVALHSTIGKPKTQVMKERIRDIDPHILVNTYETFFSPETEKILKIMGEQIKLARLRRSLSAELVAERAGISRASLWKVEKGDPSVAMGIYAAVLHALNNLDQDLLLIAKDDELGRQLQDLNLITRKRAPRRRD